MDNNAILVEHADAIDAIVSDFISVLNGMVARASKTVARDLVSKLKLTNDKIAVTARNQTILSNLDEQFQTALDAEGYQELLTKFTNQFNGQFEWFNKILSDISGELVHPLPGVTFSKGDLATFNLQQVSAQDLLTGAIVKAATRARQQAIQSIGALPVKQLTHQLTQTLGTSIAESQNLAETSISTFYRTISDRGFQLIEEDLPSFNIRYNYDGPLDKITRPFCTKLERLSRSGRTWTRAEINKMNNGQIPNVFTTCGGYRCRHQWLISVKDMRAQQKAKGPQTSAGKKTSRESVANEISARRALHSVRSKGVSVTPGVQEQMQRVRADVEATIRARRANV